MLLETASLFPRGLGTRLGDCHYATYSLVVQRSVEVNTFDGGVPVNPCDHFVLAELEVRERLVLLTEGGQEQYNPNTLMALTPKHWFH